MTLALSWESKVIYVIVMFSASIQYFEYDNISGKHLWELRKAGERKG